MNDLVTLFNFKNDKILKALSGNIGLVVRGQNSVAVVLKSPHIFNFYRQPEENKHIFIWAICGSISDMRVFEVELERFLSVFSDTFSGRDLNINLIQDFITGYLKHKFYDDKSAEPVALEFILGGVFERHMVFYIINYEGSSEVLDQKANNISLVGGGNNEDKKELLDNLSKLGTERVSAKQIIKKIGPYLRKYSGDFFALTFTVTDKKLRHKDVDRSTKKKPKIKK